MARSTESDAPFHESDIRPDDLRDRQRAAYERDIARMLARRSEFIDVPCPACASGEGKLEFEKYSLAFLRCPRCRTVYQSPRPTQKILEYYYSTSENYAFWNKCIFPRSEAVRREKIFRPRVRRVVQSCERHRIPTNTLVDVGAGFGTFGKEALLNGFSRVIAIEPTPDLARSCRDRGLDVVDKPLEHTDPDLITADVATAFEVLEHTFSPQQFLERCRALLRPGGLLVITCPNIDGFDLMVLRELSDTVDFEHLNYFNTGSLSLLCERIGLEVVEVMTPGVLDAELVRKKVLEGELSLAGQDFLKNVLIDDWSSQGTAFQEYLAANNLSSHMWLVAQRCP